MLFEAVKKVAAIVRHASLTSLVSGAIAVKTRGCCPADYIVTTKVSARLRVEWRARETHPWDRGLPPLTQAEMYRDQVLRDTEAAIIGLFKVLPEIHEVEIQVLDSREPAKVILAGTVNREDVSASYKFASVTMRLKMLGLRYSRIIGSTLEALPKEPLHEQTRA